MVEVVCDVFLGFVFEVVGLKVVFMGVGVIMESDISLSVVIGVSVLGFNVRELFNLFVKLVK